MTIKIKLLSSKQIQRLSDHELKKEKSDKYSSSRNMRSSEKREQRTSF